MIKVEQCSECNGTGYIEMKVIDYISHDMASDAGDTRLEGQSIVSLQKVTCEECNGDGFIIMIGDKDDRTPEL